MGVSLFVASIVAGAEFRRAWQAWWLGDVLGALLVAPVLLVWWTLNLVSDSLKFTPAGGRVTVRAERDGARVRISVSDTGVGIPADQLSRVVEPFFQVERGPTRRFPGVGLGLAIARDLARAMGGDVWVQDTSARGTTMAVALPAA